MALELQEGQTRATGQIIRQMSRRPGAPKLKETFHPRLTEIVKAKQIIIIKREDIEARKSARKATAVAVVDSKAAVRRGRRTGNAAISSWITERRETERRARRVLFRMVFKDLLPGTN